MSYTRRAAKVDAGFDGRAELVLNHRQASSCFPGSQPRPILAPVTFARRGVSIPPWRSGLEAFTTPRTLWECRSG